MKTNYVLIDFENVVPDNLELLDREWIRVLLFVGKSQTKIPLAVAKSMQKLGTRAQYVQMAGTGHNALDFHIAYYIGRISAGDADAFFHIVSCDQGFDPLIAHIKEEGVFSDRVARIEDIPIVAQSQGANMTPGERVQFAEERLLRSGATRPRSRKTLLSHVGNLFLKTLSAEEVEAVVGGLLAGGVVRENGKRVVYADEAAGEMGTPCAGVTA